MPLLSDAQVRHFNEEGYLTAEGGLTPAELDDAEATWDRLVAARTVGLSNSSDREKQQALAADEGFLRLMCNPYFENLAKQLLRTANVRVIELGPHERQPSSEPQPDPAAAWANGAHIDFQITSADWEATPRRDLLGLWFWVNDVPSERGAMRILPGSHKKIMEHWDKVLTPEHRGPGVLPRCHGMRPNPEPAAASYPEGITEPPVRQQHP